MGGGRTSARIMALPPHLHPPIREEGAVDLRFIMERPERKGRADLKGSDAFGRALCHLIDCILSADPVLGPTFMRKSDLADTYMSIWVQLTDVLAVAFLVPKEMDSGPQLVGFHLSVPMGFIESAPFLCAANRMVKYRAINTLHVRGASPKTPPWKHCWKHYC